MSGHTCLLASHSNYLDIGYGLSNSICLIFVSNCCPCVLIIFGKCDTCADEEPKYKEKRDVLSVRESEGCWIKDRGMGIRCSSFHFGVSDPVIHFINKYPEKIRGSIEANVALSVKICALFIVTLSLKR